MQLKSDRCKKNTAIINVTSLIDVVLLLLIFFMLTTRFVQQPGMKLDLPQANSDSPADKSENVVSISADGTILINEQKVEPDQISSVFSSLIDPSSSDNALLLKADKKIDHGTVVKIMDYAKIAGFQKLIIATEKEY
jgi:biopolymer transport protein ExbD